MGAGIQDIDAVGLVRGCLEDDLEAAEAFFLAFSPRLVRLLRRRVGDLLLAEDLAQETLIRALDSLDRFDPTRPLWPWLKTIALNLAKDNARRSEREVPCYEISGSAPDETDRCDQAIMLAQAMEALPGRHRAALSLRYLNDWRPTDAAQFLGMSRPAFDQLLLRARRRLGVEYKRMQSGLQGALLLTQDRVRSLLHETLAPAWRRVHSSGIPPSAMASASQVLTVAAVVITTIAAPGAPPRHLPGGGRAWAAPAGDGPTERERVDGKGGNKDLPDGATGRTTGTTAAEDAPWKGPEKDVTKKTNELTDPHGDVEDPEDVQITSVAFGGDEGDVVYATGKTHCRLPTCSPVLFRSEDGGRTWTRMAARNLNGNQIAAPEQRPNMVFAMGPGGLQVSRNGGNDFGPALATGAPMTTGAMAISPRWGEGDQTVMVGAQTLLRYRESTGTADPYAGSLNGPFEPAYSPIEGSDIFFLGALRPNGLTGPRAVVYRCNASGCNFTGLPDRDQLPKVRPSHDDPDLVYAFTQQDLFVSGSGGRHFSRLALPWTEPILLDLESLPGKGGLVAALASVEPTADDGVHLSLDGGATWTQSPSPLLRSGTVDIAVAGSTIVVALADRGLACSTDGGQTFARRCSNS